MSTRIAAGRIMLRRACEAAESSDGLRVLVDRLWPRGATKDAAAVDLWPKDLAPSTKLRKGSSTIRRPGRSFSTAAARKCASTPKRSNNRRGGTRGRDVDC
jgi:uncharacterized protein YeaO (DUF488 family)